MNMRILLLLSLVATICDATPGISKETDREQVRGPQARVAAQSVPAEVETSHLFLVLMTLAVLCDACQAEQRSSELQGERTDALRTYLDGLQTPTRPTSRL